MPRDERHTATIPYGTLGIIPLANYTKMDKKINKFHYTGVNFSYGYRFIEFSN